CVHTRLLSFPTRRSSDLSQRDELSMLRTHGVATPHISPVLSAEACLTLQAMTRRVHVEDDVLEYATNLTRFTRGHPQVALGCSRSEEHTSELQSRENLVC